MSYCCVNCFDADEPKDEITSSNSYCPDGTCDFCRSTKVPCCDPFELHTLFDPLLDHFELPQYGTHFFDSDDLPIGDTLGNLLQQEWNIFSERLMSTGNYDELLSEIFSSVVNVKDLWINKLDSRYYDPHEQRTLWQRFSDHLKTKRRFILATSELGIEDFESQIRSVLNHAAITVEKGTQWYRARIGLRYNKKGLPAPFTPNKMSAPPPNPHRSGRANPFGISYLYVASTPEAAVAELKPAKGTLLSVARILSKRQLHVTDLSSIKPIRSPFDIDFYEYKAELQARELLSALSWELSKPVSADDPPLEYIPSQYLCELILDSNYDGVIYQSGFSEGLNMVIFDVTAARVMRNIQLVKVDSIGCQIEYIDANDVLEVISFEEY